MAELDTTTTTEKTSTTPAKSTYKTNEYWTVGRRKAAIARVKLVTGKGEMTINDKSLEQYAPHALQKAKIQAPLVATDRQTAFDITVRVVGGGSASQLDAISLGIARALLRYDANLRSTLRQSSLLTR